MHLDYTYQTSDFICHDVFNVCDLRKYHARLGDSVVPSTIQVDGAAEWYIREIVDE